MWFSSWYQLRAILWKNWLQKKAHFVSFLAELLLPVLFMAILIGIKAITTKYDSPNVAYFCGETYPWFYTDTSDLGTALNRTGPFQCLQKPDQCTASNYYQKSTTLDLANNELTAYRQYGYIMTPNTDSKGTNVFYAFMVGSDYNTTKALPYLENPSLPFCQILEKIEKNNAVLGVAPNNDNVNTATQQFYNYLQNYDCTGYVVNKNESLKYFTSESSLEDYVKDTDYDDIGFTKVAFAYVINSVDITNANWDYSIRVNYTTDIDSDQSTVACLYGNCDFRYTIPTTKYYTEDLLKPQLSDYMYGYSYSGFSTLQLMIDQYIMKQYTSTTPDIKASMSLMPTKDYESDDFQYVISSVLGIFYILAFLYPVSRLIRALVLEKEFRIKEGMKMMGLTDTVYNLSWFITGFLQMTLIAILITLVSSTTVFEYSNKFYVFVYFEGFGLSIMSMCFLLATLFSRSKTASLIGPMVFFVTFFPYYAVNDPQYDESSKTATCLLAPACFALGANVFADFEGGLVGVQDDNVNQLTSNFTYSACVGMLFLDAFLYGILAFYLDKVLPSEFGTSLPFYFPLMPSYWCGTSSGHHQTGTEVGIWERFLIALGLRSHHRVSRGDKGDNEDIEAIDPMKRQFFETVPAELKHQIDEEKCVSIRKLRRVFKNPAGGDDRIAVDSLNLDMFQNQVTVLLGHNGAGKTTVISMLVGMIPATSGNVFLPGGLDIQHDMAAIRRGLGVCPQHDILFPELTVLQHLQIFAAFKGVTPSKVNAEANKIIAEVGLREKANSKSSTLSGGQKRKLSLGIALIGDSKVVILDEPTSGMDPFSRRSTWNIIQRNKKGRVILLTTHFMDEADLLGDRVAIMAHGKLQCCGSPLFLKNRFGVGYTLTIVKESQGKVETSRLQQISRMIDELVKSYIPAAEPLNDVGAEQSLRLPFSASSQFVALFEELDSQKKKLGISEYGISVTTLEEVFLRVADLEAEEAHALLASNPPPNEAPNLTMDPSKGKFEPLNIEGEANENSDRTTDGKYIAPADDPVRTDYADFELKNPFWQHFKALFIKRAIYAKRDTRMICCQLILPVIIVIVGLSLLLLQPNFNQPDLVLNPSKFNPDFSYSQRNYVPFLTPTEPCTVCDAMENAFQGVEGSGVWGVAMPVTAVSGDAFAGCAVGAAPLNNVSQYLINTPRTDLDTEGGSTIYGTVTLAEGTDNSNLIYNILVNASALHGPGVFMNLVHQSYLQAITGKSTASITAHNHPLPQTHKQENQSASIDAFVVSLFVMIAFCFIPASFTVFVVKEREVKAKHQQVISGVSIYAYWMSTYLWDTISYLPTAALVIAIMYAYKIDAYTKGDAAGAVVALLLLYGPATAGMSYLLSYFFSSHSTAQVAVMFFNFITGLCLMVVAFVLSLVGRTKDISNQLRYFFRLFPSFCLGDGILQLTLCTGGNDCVLLTELDGTTVGPYDMNIAGADIVFLGWQIVIYFGLAVLIEYLLTFPSLLAWLSKVHDPGVTSTELSQDDEDVAIERSRVNAGQADHDIIKIHDLRKLYPMGNKPKVAVHSLSFGIPKGECFGFLGINGAGKTTTLSILSGEFPPTSGNAYVDGYSIALDQSKIRRKIGYCPQFDALLELLTVREHLELYGRIKGLEGDALEAVVKRKMRQLDLLDFENKTSGSLSGGNKRKLSVAVATIGDPPIVFLDEPSTGMDPKARRFMWKVIARMSTQDAHCSVILTTHSMEEAEALCTRIGIMVAGRLRCLGSSQHLKHRFGNGFEVNIKMQAPSEDSLLQVLSQLLSQKIVRVTNPSANNRSPRDVRPVKDDEITVELLDQVRMNRTDLSSVAQALNNPDRLREITSVSSGATIHDALEGEGTVTAGVFLDWWLSEDTFQALHHFMETEFNGRAQLLERSGVHSCRYRIQKVRVNPAVSNGNTNEQDEDDGNHLSEIFAKIEAKKDSLHVQEYSVAQTTLEQIFNQFASLQDNPEVGLLPQSVRLTTPQTNNRQQQYQSVVQVDP